VEFAFFDPKETDYHGLCTLMQNWLGADEATTASWPHVFRNMADLISKQASVGTLIKADGAEEDAAPLAFLSALNLNTHRGTPSMRYTLNFLKSNAPKDKAKRFNQVISDGISGKKQVGLLVHDRLINLPPTLIPVLHTELTKDIEWAQKNEDTSALKKSFKFTTFIYVSKAFYPDEESGEPEPAPASKKASKREKKRTGKEERRPKTRPRAWFRFEDKVLESLATLSFAFPLKKKTRRLPGYRLARPRAGGDGHPRPEDLPGHHEDGVGASK